MPTIVKNIAADVDDGTSKVDGSGATWIGPWLDFSASNLGDATREVSLTIFRGITVPAGSAFQDGCGVSYLVDNKPNVRVRLYGELTLDSIDGGTNPDIVSRTKTTAFVDWIGATTPSARNDTPELKDIFNELLALGGGELTNANLAIIIEGKDDSNVQQYAQAFGSGQANAPILTLNHDVAVPSNLTGAKVTGDILSLEFDEPVTASDAAGITLAASGGAVSATGRDFYKRLAADLGTSEIGRAPSELQSQR